MAPTLSDEALLDTALEIVHRSGPAALSHAALAKRVGLASSTIVQRFGTKGDLLRATLVHAWGRLEASTAAAVAKASHDTDGVIDLIVSLSSQYDTDAFGDDLMLLREDLRDPLLRERGAAWIASITDAVDQRLGDAGAHGLGEIVVAHWQGTLIVWSFHRWVPLSVEVRRSLEALLARLIA